VSTSAACDTLHAALTPVQAQLVAALARGASVTAAAREAGVHRSTVHLWRNSPAFSAAVDEACTGYAEELRDGLRDLSALALSSLRVLLESDSTPPGVRLRAALSILQRPHFPKPGWHLPERLESPLQQQALDGLAAVKAEYDYLRMAEKTQKVSKSVEFSPPPGPPESPDPASAPPAPARNSPCSCGSGLKFKRCHGSGAPPVLNFPASPRPSAAT
jgi:SEC-C motif